jgi:extracellular factor (EF) 3-hydroxypalmitic acid methyl ester biosynthesis protein
VLVSLNARRAASVKPKTYDELTGAHGREMFYRAERFRGSDVFKRGSPQLTLAEHPYTLHDISLSGLAAIVRHQTSEPCGVGEPVAVRLALRDESIFEAKGKVVRIEPLPSGTKIGVRFLDHGFDVAQTVTRYQKLLTRADLDECDKAGEAVSPEYRQLCADILHLLRSYRAVLDRFEATQPDPAAAREMLAACEERAVPRWRALWERGNQLVMSMDQDGILWRAAKHYTELVLTPDFSLGAFARRAYEKPLGYPGDFEVMNMAYDWRHEGKRLAEKFVHRIGLEVGRCIATRMTVMRQAMAETAPAGGRDVARIASLGCGPAREVIDYLKAPRLSYPVEFTLIDQDRSALSQAYERSLPEVMRHHGTAVVSCVHASFAQLLSAGELFGKFPDQDLIYSVGLVDYLAPRRAKELVHSLYDHLAPGGRLIVANLKAGASSTLWPMEFIADWSLIYRTDRDLLDLAASLPGADSTTSQDSTGHVCILTVQKQL